MGEDSTSGAGGIVDAAEGALKAGAAIFGAEAIGVMATEAAAC
jgi:hypothetical protein